MRKGFEQPLWLGLSQRERALGVFNPSASFPLFAGNVGFPSHREKAPSLQREACASLSETQVHGLLLWFMLGSGILTHLVPFWRHSNVSVFLDLQEELHSQWWENEAVMIWGEGWGSTQLLPNYF